LAVKRILLVDNYDSFTYNLVHSLEQNADVEVLVVRNNALLNLDITNFHGFVISPGPGLPKDTGDLPLFFQRYHTQIPVLGICLGHQFISEFFGATLTQLQTVLHGTQLKTNLLQHQDLFFGLPSVIDTGHYHSWVINKVALPAEIKITASNAQGGIMAIRHQSLPIFGIQFHPESVLTPMGNQIIANWLNTITGTIAQQ
jgi:anthranilate synthase/aminodeoxychorismate synthase-like glutamine amidotransferase